MRARYLLISVVVLFIAGVLAASGYAELDPKTCVGMWLFDEGQGNTAKDSSGNRNHGTLLNSPKWADGKFGKALDFDGRTAYVNMGANTLNMGDDGFTVSMWVNARAKGSTLGIVSKKGNMSLAPVGYSLGMANSGSNWAIRVGDGVNYVEAQGSAVALDNSWRFIVGTFDGETKTVKLYENGILMKQGANALIGNIDNNNLFKVAFLDFYFNGIIDDVAVFNVPLELEDIGTLMNKGLRESIGITAVDVSGKLTTTWAIIKAQ